MRRPLLAALTVIAVAGLTALYTNGDSGHGSHVAGTAAGFGVQQDGTTFRGGYDAVTDLTIWQIGPGSALGAGLCALGAFGDIGGSTDLVINALEWAADPNGDHNFGDHLDVLNLPFGSDATPADDPENLFVDRLSDLGVLSVMATAQRAQLVERRKLGRQHAGLRRTLPASQRWCAVRTPAGRRRRSGLRS